MGENTIYDPRTVSIHAPVFAGFDPKKHCKSPSWLARTFGKRVRTWDGPCYADFISWRGVIYLTGMGRAAKEE